MMQKLTYKLTCIATLSLSGMLNALAQPQQAPLAPSAPIPNVQSNQPIQVQIPQQPSNRLPKQQQYQQQQVISSGAPTNYKDLKHLVNELPKVQTKSYDRPQIHLALILDVSGSMEGLLNQAREELWKVINLFNEIEYQGSSPEIRVALYTHGMSEASNGLFLEKRLSLTTDLDQVSEILFSIKTRGSLEFSPSSLLAASQGLEWSSAANDFKAIIIAGNEEFVQGPLTMKEGFRVAKERALITHTIHCGSPEQGIKDLWKKAAQLGGGQFLNINQNAKQQYIETPFDDQIQEKNSQLNKTYIPYGRLGKRGIAKQKAQDMNASKMSKASAIQRSITKSNSYYSNDQWDLVDAYRKKSINLAKIQTKSLPKELQSLDPQALESYIRNKQKQRNEIQAQIAKLKNKRSIYLKEERSKRALSGKKRLDSVLIDALRKQALSLGFKWKVNALPEKN